jgi:predicted HD superfamily hydrolase involved in NAD metabolism
MEIGSIKAWLEKNLDKERYYHTLGCAQQALQLAQMFRLDGQKAYIAGLLHDCAKGFPKEELTKIIKEHMPDITECELKSAKALHAPVSAYLAQKEFGVDDPEILSAIRLHTLGKVDMSEFESIVFLADKIEPNTRDILFQEEILRTLTVGIAGVNRRQGLDLALLECFRQTIASLVERNLYICPITIEVYNSLQERVRAAS